MHYFPHCDERSPNLSGCKSQTPLVARRFRHVRENGRWHSPLQGISCKSLWLDIKKYLSHPNWFVGLDLLNHKDLLWNLFFSLQIINMAAPDTIDERVTDKLKLLLKTNSKFEMLNDHLLVSIAPFVAQRWSFYNFTNSQVINKGKKISIFKQHENLTLARNSARYWLQCW